MRNVLENYIHPIYFFFFSSRRRHTRLQGDWSSDVCSSDLDEKWVWFEMPSDKFLIGSGEVWIRRWIPTLVMQDAIYAIRSPFSHSGEPIDRTVEFEKQHRGLIHVPAHVMNSDLRWTNE